MSTESTMVELGMIAPAFALPDVVSGRVIRRNELAAGAKALLVMFVCPHCPYVKHVERELAEIGAEYEGRVAMAAISSNDIAAYPQDGPEGMKEQAKRMGWKFPYLFDETQEVARNYGAACTPDFYLFDEAMTLVYHGQLDDSRPRRGDKGNDLPVSGADLRRAMDEVLADRTPSRTQKTSIGCGIKWRE